MYYIGSWCSLFDATQSTHVYRRWMRLALIKVHMRLSQTEVQVTKEFLKTFFLPRHPSPRRWFVFAHDRETRV